MNILQAIILGIIQGLAEFLPISSSAHLIIIPWLLKWQEHTLTFDVALHIGTLISLLVYFFKDYLTLIIRGITKPVTEEGRLFWYIVITMIPAAVAGVLLEDIIDGLFRKQILWIALVLFLFGIVIFLVDKLAKKEKPLNKMNFLYAFIIGLSQVFALFPGVSRSGITMTAGMALGFKREEAAKFSFLLSAPVIFGAGLLSFAKNIETIQHELSYFIIGVITSAIVGFLAIHFLLNFVKQHSFTPFVVYRIILALIVLIVYLINQ